MLSVATGGDISVSAAQLGGGAAGAIFQPATNNNNNSSSSSNSGGAAGQTGVDAADQAQFEADKRAVYKHPLFPLLALLFERCELATQSSDPQSSDAFNLDIQAFVQHQERDRKPFLANEPEIDGLMIKAIQVLRIHLLELEKVQELCKDFCNRYITCLKGKMQSENLLRSDYPAGSMVGGMLIGGGSGGGGGGGGGAAPSGATMESNNNSLLGGHHSDSGSSQSNSPVQYSISPSVASVASSNPLDPSGQQQQQQPPPFNIPPPQQPPPPHYMQQPISMELPHNMQHAQQMLAQCDASAAAMVVHGSTPLGQIGVNLCVVPGAGAASIGSDASGPLSPAATTPDGSGDECDDGSLGGAASMAAAIGGRKAKRGVLPKHATSVMRSWLFQHLVHPYPTEDEKRHIAAQTNLTLLQVNNWFINARRRILQPMLDASAPPADTAPSSGGEQNSPPSNMAQRKRKHVGGAVVHNHNRRAWSAHFGNAIQAQLDGGGLLSSSDDDDEGDDDDDDDDDAFSSDGECMNAQHENGHAHTTDAPL